MAGETGEQLVDQGGSSAPLKIAPIPDGYRTADTDDGRYSVVSNFETDQKGLEAAISDGKGKDEVKEAASKLGKKGGEASAEKRKAEAKEKPSKADEARITSDSDAGADSDDGGSEAGSREGVSDGDGKPLGKPDRDPRARVAEATREAREARREAAEAREEARRIRWEVEQERRQRTEPREQEAPQRDPSARPKLEDFEDYDQYTEALTDWKVDQKFGAIEERQSRETQVHHWAEGARKSMETFDSRAREADESDPGWRDRVDDRLWDAFKPTWMLEPNEPVRQKNVIFDEIYGSEAMPSLLLYFSDEAGQKEFSRIARLQSPREISREMAKLEERLRPATAGTRPETSVSKAPLPFQPVKGAPHTGDRPPGDDASYEEHKAYWTAKDRKSASR